MENFGFRKPASSKEGDLTMDQKEKAGVASIAAARSRVIIKTSLIGIVVNVILAAGKAAVGILTNSIAIVLDAINNLSDALSSVITILGAKFANRKPDKKHPLGYGRIEYLSAMIVSTIVLYAGISSLVESVKKIIHPEAASYTTVSLVVLAAAIAAKLLLGSYVKSRGKAVNSGSLIASGADASFDAVLSASVLASALVYIFFHISIEAYVGVLIAAAIIKAGIEMVSDTLNDFIGRRPDAELVRAIKKTIREDPDARGAYDLILNDYGPNMVIGSVHVEVLDTLTAEQIDSMARRITNRVYSEHGVLLTGVGVYSINTSDDAASEMRSRITHMVVENEGVLQMHGFYADMQKKTCSFDIIIDFDIENRTELFTKITEKVQSAYPDFVFSITMDIDI